MAADPILNKTPTVGRQRAKLAYFKLTRGPLFLFYSAVLVRVARNVVNRGRWLQIEWRLVEPIEHLLFHIGHILQIV
jgi:hypothetical protein